MRLHAALFFTGFVCALPLQARAAILFSDTFDSETVATIAGRSPSGENLLGVQWQTFGLSSLVVRTTTASTVSTTYNADAFIDIQGRDSGIKNLTISADLKLASMDTSGGVTQGIGLGFYQTARSQGQDPKVHFRGFVLNASGTLSLISVTSGGSATTYATAAWSNPSAFDTSSFYTLTYTINTTTGGVANVSLGGIDLTSAFSSVTGVFTNDLIKYAAFYGKSATAQTGYLDNFSLSTSAIPEPGTSAFIGGIGAALACIFMRRLR
ncbi:hypothetical protein OPIT5_26285 [Opitutaceae bacterium TAV5]|nr:hypothetical protein OPIT5_26285 [Opitutaceae bacterium TAV5]